MAEVPVRTNASRTESSLIATIPPLIGDESNTAAAAGQNKSGYNLRMWNIVMNRSVVLAAVVLAGVAPGHPIAPSDGAPRVTLTRNDAEHRVDVQIDGKTFT